jgi:hypothetical protein
MAGLLAVATRVHGGVFTTVTYTGDADSGISPTKTYTHAIDFNASGDGYTTLNINGVQLVNGPPGDQTPSLKYNLNAENEPFSIGSLGTNYDPGLSGNIDKLLRNFFYGSAQDEVLTISGLLPNTTYRASFYAASFDNTAASKGGRYSHVTDSQGGSVVYDENQTAGTASGSILRDTYTTGPTDTSITITFSIDTTDGVGNHTANTDSYHQYGFTNEVVPEPTSSTIVVALGVVGMGARRRRRAA